MATVSRAELANLLEKVIDPALRKLYVDTNKSPVVRMWMEGRNGGEGTKLSENGQVYITVKNGRHSNMQSQGEGATLIRGRGRDSQASFLTKTLPGSFTFTLKAKKSSEKRAGALVDTTMNEVEGMMERAKAMMAFYANNDGTGVIGLVNDASPTAKATVTVDNVRATTLDLLLDPGDSLQVGTAAEQLLGTGFPCTVASIDLLTQFTTSETQSGTADNDTIYYSEAYDVGNAVFTGKIGLDGLLATSGTVQNIPLATALYYQSLVETTGEVVSETRVLEYLQRADARVKDSSTFMIQLGDLWWKLVSLMKGTTMTDSESVKKMLQGGAAGLRISWFGGDTPIIYDPYCRPGYVNGLDLYNMGYRQEWPLELVDGYDVLAHRISQKLEWEVAAAEDGNFYVIDPRANFKLTGKTTS